MYDWEILRYIGNPDEDKQKKTISPTIVVELMKRFLWVSTKYLTMAKGRCFVPLTNEGHIAVTAQK